MNLPETYVPGRAWQKLLLAGFGTLIFAFGVAELSVPLGLLFRGESAQAEAWRIVLDRPGQPGRIFTDDPELAPFLPESDRSVVFWNEFRFTTRDGREVTARLPVGGHGRPLLALRDSEGLPAAMMVFYHPTRPDQAVFPFVIGTWFLPGIMTFLGLLGMVIGLVLFRNASRPIDISTHPNPLLHQPRN